MINMPANSRLLNDQHYRVVATLRDGRDVIVVAGVSEVRAMDALRLIQATTDYADCRLVQEKFSVRGPSSSQFRSS